MDQHYISLIGFTPKLYTKYNLYPLNLFNILPTAGTPVRKECLCYNCQAPIDSGRNFTLNTVYCKLFTLYYTLYIIYCTLYNVGLEHCDWPLHCTLV